MLTAACVFMFGAWPGCDVYTPDLLSSAVEGGVGGRTVGGGGSSGGRAPGGSPSLGGSLGGGLSIGGGSTTAGRGGSEPSVGGAGSPSNGGAAGSGVGGISIHLGGTAPGSGGGTAGSGGIGGIGSSGGAGSSATGGAAGTSVGTGGLPTNGGIPAAGGKPAAGGATGGVGTGGTAACNPAVLDDMHDSSAAILACGGRNGTWYSFGTDALLSPAPKEPFKKVALSATDQAIVNAKYAAKLQGGAPQTDCGMGFTLRVQNDGTKVPYSLAGAKLAFKYRTKGIGNGILSLAVPLQTTIPKLEGGTCAEPCYNHYFYRLGPSGTANDGWLAMEIPLVASPDPGFAQNPFWLENVVDWEPTLAMMIQLTVSSAQSAPYTIEVGPIELVQ